LSVLLAPNQFPALSGALQKAFSASLPDMDIRFVQRERGIDFVKAVQTGEADISFLFADSAYLAFVGELDGQRYDRLRGIAVLDALPLYIVVRGTSDIHSVEGLRNQRVSVGVPGSGMALIGNTVLDALGIAVNRSHQGFPEAEAMLENGTLDAAFVIGNYPVDRLETALRHGARILSLSQANVERLRRLHPFVRPTVIPRDAAGNGPVLTIALDRLMVCRSGLDDDLVYAITRAFFGSLPDLSAAFAPFRQMNAEDAPATPIPLHEGAARYYREQAAL
jgi:TRAP transporter TAXI family solute receptor